MARALDEYGAFLDKFVLEPTSSSHELPLHGLTFAVKDIFDVEGYVTGFGNPDWARTHSAAASTAPAVSAILRGGATCIGKTVMDEMAYSINGENYHYGTPTNPCAPDRVPGGSSSGSAVSVSAKLVDFSLGTDTGGSVRVPASYCGILGFRPSHGVVSTAGLTPMAQSFDTVGWFARDPVILNRVGGLLLQSPDADPALPSQIIIADDCFQLSTIPNARLTQILVKSFEKLFGVRRNRTQVVTMLGFHQLTPDKCDICLFNASNVVKHLNLGDYVDAKVPSLKHFMTEEIKDQEYNIPSLAALSSAMRSLQRHEFKNNHGEWVTSVKPHLGPGISDRVSEAVRSTGENVDICQSVKAEIRAALMELIPDSCILAIPTVPGPPPKLQTDPSTLEVFRARAFSLLSISGVSGFCQVSIPLGSFDDLPVSISLLAKHGSDGFLLFDTLQEQVKMAE